MRRYSATGPYHEDWWVTPVDGGDVVATVNGRRSLPGPPMIMGEDLYLSRHDRFVVTLRSSRRFRCDADDDPCPCMTGEDSAACKDWGTDSRVAIYDPKTKNSVVFGNYLVQAYPDVEWKGSAVSVKTDVCQADYDFASPKPPAAPVTPQPATPTNQQANQSPAPVASAEACPAARTVDGPADPLQHFDSFQHLHYGIVHEFEYRQLDALEGEAARARICSAIAAGPLYSHQVFIGVDAPRDPSIADCSAPAIHELRLYPEVWPGYQTWYLAAVANGGFVTAVEEHAPQDELGESAAALRLERAGDYIVAVKTSRNFRCATDMSQACATDGFGPVCPDVSDAHCEKEPSGCRPATDPTCARVGYDSRVVVYDPLARRSIIFAGLEQQTLPKVEVDRSEVKVTTGTCSIAGSFEKPE